MGFFGDRDDQGAEQAAPAARDEEGGVPAGPESRLRELGTEGSMFTSGLSVNEFSLLDRLGSQPLAQVMGASVVRPGWQYLPALPPGSRAGMGRGAGRTSGWAPGLALGTPPPGTGGTWAGIYTEASPAQVRNYQWHADVVCELEVLSDAWNLARRRALDRLSEEASQVGADAVVGVHLQRSDHDLGKGTIEYVVTGTAIRLPNAAGAATMLSDVSVQDYWRLRGAGHEPVGLLATTAVVFASASRSTRLRRQRTRPQNQELDELSRGFQTARETVRARLRGQASDAHGAGAVGVELSHSVRRDKLALASSLGSPGQRGWNRGRLGMPYFVSGHADVERRGWVITMHAAGTAVRRRQHPSQLAPKTQIRIGAR